MIIFKQHIKIIYLFLLFPLLLLILSCQTPLPPGPGSPVAAPLPTAPPAELLKGGPLPFKATVAVLPLDNISKKSELEWHSEGIPESLIAKLQNVRSLHMVERMRIRRVIDEQKLQMSGLVDPGAVRETGKLLGADTILTGTFQESRGEIRINVRLVQVETGSVLRAIEETGTLDRIFQVQDRLAARLVAELGYRMEEDEGRRMTLYATNSLDAYQFYIRGRDQYFRFNREGYEKAVEFYREAIRLDPGFVLAHAGIGDALATLSYSRRKAGESYDGLLRQASEAAEKAVALNPASSEAHRALAHAHNNAFYFQESRREAEKALALNPNDAEAWYLLGQAATTAPVDLDRAEICYNHALRLNSSYAMAYNSLGWYVYLERKWYDKAAEVFKRAIQISPDFVEAHDSLGEAYFRMGRYPEAAAAFKKALELQPSHKHAGQRYPEAMKKIGK
ncbi:MAG: FlgO family outer membrane protein [Deltaproteobacteria bacterium]